MTAAATRPVVALNLGERYSVKISSFYYVLGSNSECKRQIKGQERQKSFIWIQQPWVRPPPGSRGLWGSRRGRGRRAAGTSRRWNECRGTWCCWGIILSEHSTLIHQPFKTELLFLQLWFQTDGKEGNAAFLANKELMNRAERTVNLKSQKIKILLSFNGFAFRFEHRKWNRGRNGLQQLGQPVAPSILFPVF